MHSFHSVLVKKRATMDYKLRVVEVPPTLQPEIPTLGGISDGCVCCELRKPH